MLNSFNRFSDTGMLLLRTGVGLIFMTIHGYAKISGGPERWVGLGSSMSALGINFLPGFWGFMSAFTEFVVPLFIIFGFLFRPAALLLTINMAVALSTHFIKLDPWGKIAYPLELVILFFALFLIGPGRYSIDEFLSRRKIRNK
ncbi:MAG: DoxX family protein [Ignavibacteria bacterium]